MRFRIFFVALILPLLTSCMSNGAEMYSLAPGGPHAVSMVSLLMEPEKYKDEHIEVHGYLGKFPNLAVFLTHKINKTATLKKRHANCFRHASKQIEKWIGYTGKSADEDTGVIFLIGGRG